jgi:hypothetical protein
MVRLYQNTNIKKLLEYQRNTNIEDYFENINDYDTVSNGVLIDGESTVKNMMGQLAQKPNASDRVIPEIDTTYFFKIGNSLYLARNFETLEDAENMIISRRAFLDIAVYSFVSPTDIRYILGNERANDKILGYKTAGINMYTSLIKVDEKL